jgi:hypothetical protein
MAMEHGSFALIFYIRWKFCGCCNFRVECVEILFLPCMNSSSN